MWIDGTEFVPSSYQTMPDQFYMMEMLQRGFIAVTVEYDDSVIDYASACEGNRIWDFKGFTHKAREIFDGSVADSVISQLCDGPNAIANCRLGIASHGFSQGAHIAALGSNYEPRVSASLLFGNGNFNSYISARLECTDNDNISLPRERRRSISGDADRFFGGSFSGVLKQQKETSGYDCADNFDCFRKLPAGCSYGAGEQYCEEYGRFFTLSCPAHCSTMPEEGPCPSNRDLITNACPDKVPDTYLGGDALIEDTGGYYIVTGEEYCNYMGCDPDGGAIHTFFQDWHAESDFLNPDKVWGLKQNLDWLARIARKTASVPALTSSVTPTPSKSPSAKSSPAFNPQPDPEPKRSPTAKPWWCFWCQV